jgi:membrane-bound metal-dependent hydrolase YbcI (DUF457 family)
MVGGMLPDLIDKPLGHLALPLNNGRIFAHTLLFAIVLLSAGIVFRKLLPLSLGVSSHQLLDSMFSDPGTALWPLLGPFPETEFELSSWFDSLMDPQVVLWELLGALTISLFLVLRSKDRLRAARQR